MPCNSDYLAPNRREEESQRMAQSIMYINSERNIQSSHTIIEAASNIYGGHADSLAVELCRLCTEMSKEEEDRIIYNGRHKIGRQLANWWDEHQEADKERMKKEKESKGWLQ